jgi:predicted nucleic acid-binding protein
VGYLSISPEMEFSESSEMPVTQLPGTPAAVAELMAEFLARPGHEFWPDDVSLLGHQRVHCTHLLESAQVIDSYLLALAAAHGGALATFDRQLVPDAFTNGWQSLHLIV